MLQSIRIRYKRQHERWGSIVLTAVASIALVYFILPELMTRVVNYLLRVGVLGTLTVVGRRHGGKVSLQNNYAAMGKRPGPQHYRQSSTGRTTTMSWGIGYRNAIQ